MSIRKDIEQAYGEVATLVEIRGLEAMVKRQESLAKNKWVREWNELETQIESLRKDLRARLDADGEEA